MASKVPTSQNETTRSDKMQSNLNNGNTNLPQKSEEISSSSSSKVLTLGCLIYFTYSVAISVDSQFLSLYYKSKGFGGTTVGMLYSITPLTAFLTIPIWGALTRVGGNEKNSSSSMNEKATTRPFQILCLNIIIATMGQVSLAILDKPIYMMIAITVAGIFSSPVKPMLDGILMDHLEDSSNVGRVRFFMILGSGVGTNLGGRLLELAQNNLLATGDDNELNNFWTFVSEFSSGFGLLFLARFILTIPTLICIRQLQNRATMNVKINKISKSNDATKPDLNTIGDKPSENGKKESISVLSVARDVAKHSFGDRNHLLFFICIYIAGFSGGVSDVFSNLRYQESGCSTTHIGQSRLLSSCAGAVMFWFSGRVTRTFGVQNVLVLSMICAGFRFYLLHRMDHPYYVYLVDFIRGSTYGAFWSSSTIYASQVGPQSLRGSILLLLNGIYNGIGRSTGSIVGGKFQAMFGTDNLFLYCARMNYTLALVMGVSFSRKRKSDLKNESLAAAAKKTE